MKKSALLGLLAAASVVLSTALQAGGLPNSTRTLTTGISSGTTASRVPGSHPYTTQSRASRSRNSSADISLSNYRRGYTAQSGSGHTAPSSAHGRPSSFPGHGSSHMNDMALGKTEGKLPSFSSFPPSRSNSPATAGSSGIPASATTAQPASLPPPLPDAAAAGRVPASIPPVSAGGGMPAVIPALPDAATTRIPDAAADGLANRGRGRP